MAIPLLDIIGRARQQYIFSALVAVVYAIWAGVSNSASTGGLIVLFTISQLLLNTGPNATTWLIPAEVFPTRVRGTAHGISAASGKVGALLTAFTFGSAVDTMGLRGTLGLLSGVMMLCALISFWIPEVKGLSLDDIENDVHYGSRAKTDVKCQVDSTSYLHDQERQQSAKEARSNVRPIAS